LKAYEPSGCKHSIELNWNLSVAEQLRLSVIASFKQQPQLFAILKA